MPIEFFIMARLRSEIPDGEAVPVYDHVCDRCGRMCGISPSSRESIEAHGWPVYCQQCVKETEDESNPTTYVSLVKGIEERRLNEMAREAKERRN